MRGDHLLFSCALFALSLNHICLSSGYCPYVPGIGAENGVLSVSAMGNKLQDDHGLVEIACPVRSYCETVMMLNYLVA